MKASVIVSFTGNPYIAIVFKKIYEAFWKSEIDQLIVGINDADKEVVDFIENLWKKDSKTVVWKDYAKMGQGATFNHLYPLCQGDVLITMDSDNWVIRHGVLSGMMEDIIKDKYDAIGSFGFCCDHPRKRMEYVDKFGTVRLNPFLSFWRRSMIEKAGRPNFGMRIFKESGNDLVPIQPEDIKDRSKLFKYDEMAYFSVTVFESNPGVRIKKISAAEGGRYLHIGGLSNVSRFYITKEKLKKHVGKHRCAFLKLLYEGCRKECTIPGYNEAFESLLQSAIQTCKFTDAGLETYLDEFSATNKINLKGLF